jgi:cytoskeleton protein RodZ
VTEGIDSRTAPAAPTSPTPGEVLRAAREKAGWTPERLAAELGLPIARLRALEADEHESFGGVVFVRGYLRRAALLLGTSPEPLITAYEARCCAARPTEILPGLPPGRLPSRGAPTWLGPAFGLAAAAAFAGGAWWLLGVPAESPPAARVTEAPPTMALELQAPEAESAAPADAAELRADARTPEAGTAAPPPDATAGDLEVVAEAVAPEPAPAPVQAPAEAGRETVAESLAAGDSAVQMRVAAEPEPLAPRPGTVELRLEFTEDCWVEVHDAEESRLAYRLYRAGDVTRLRGVAPVSVFLGNAEGVRLSVDGSAMALRPAARRDGTARFTVGGGAG